MKIVHLAYSDLGGGSAQTSFRIHTGFLKLGIDSKLIVRNKRSLETHIIRVGDPPRGIPHNIRASCDHAALEFNRLWRKKERGTQSLNWMPSRVAPMVNRLNPDAVIVHWIGAGAFSINDLEKVRAPLLWRLADEWLYSGTDHFASDLEYIRVRDGYLPTNRYKTGCLVDLDRITWCQKFRHRNLFRDVVAPSHWIAERASKSRLLRDARIRVIPNPTDETFFEDAREVSILDSVAGTANVSLARGGNLYDEQRGMHRISGARPSIVFVSSSDIEDPRKGLHHLLAIYPELCRRNPEVEIRLIGPFSLKHDMRLDHKPFKLLGQLNKFDIAREMRQASATVIPSSQEGLPQVALEALASGCPVVGFARGALDHIVRHRLTGYLAEFDSNEELLIGLDWAINNSSERLRVACKQDAANNFSYEKVIPQYRSVLEALTSSGGATHSEKLRDGP